MQLPKPNQGLAIIVGFLLHRSVSSRQLTAKRRFGTFLLPLLAVSLQLVLGVRVGCAQGTILQPGDIVIVGVNAHNGGCDFNQHYDFVSFVSFKPITSGTELIITDNGYERCLPGKWGNSEGTVRMTRTGGEIPAGQVITFRIKNVHSPQNVVAVGPDPDWSWASLNHPANAPPPNYTYTLALNNGGDQLFFMQGGTWDSGTYTNGNNNHDATYDGTILFGFSTNPTYNWSALCANNANGNRRSNLPPGMECFSMAPTSTTDFAKYTGPLTTATQRDWILRIENTDNWSSFWSCAAYNNDPPNWYSAPILPIIPGGVSNGLWLGTVNTDWFNCRNWDDARVPGPMTNVLITENAENSCVVGLASGVNPGGMAECASVSLTSNSGVQNHLAVQDGGTLTVGDHLLIHHSSGPNLLYTEVGANSTLNAGSISIMGHTIGSGYESSLIANSFGSIVNVTGDLKIDTGGHLTLSGAPGASGTLTIGGDFINLVDEEHFNEDHSTVILNGHMDQAISTPGFSEVFYNLNVSKVSGDVFLESPIIIKNRLSLDQGRIFSDPVNHPTLPAGAMALNASHSSFVHGPLSKLGNSDFIFPIGKNTSYRPASLQNVVGDQGASFTAEYFHASPAIEIGPDLDAPLEQISNCEYWQIDRNADVASTLINLSWEDPISCGVSSVSDLRIAYWDGAAWIDRGASSVTGTPAAGNLNTAAAQTAFSQPANYWTLASINADNPLPIQLLSFDALAVESWVSLQWSTASEQYNDYFTIERSIDAYHFNPIIQVPGAGNSQSIIEYSANDVSPLRGISYYRLRQTDLDGTSTLSHTVPIMFSGAAIHQPLEVLHTPHGSYLLHGFPLGSALEPGICSRKSATA